MFPSARRVAALLLFAVAALFVFPAARQALATEPADARPAPSIATVPLKPLEQLARRAVTEPAPAALAPVRSKARARSKPTGYTILRIRAGQSIALRAKPGGAPVARLRERTEFGTKRVLAVAEVRGRWLGVLVPERPNGKLGWVDRGAGGLERGRTKISLRADLSSHRLELRVGRRVVKRMKVAIGRPGSTTPTGRFAVTDKLSGGRFGPYYGCCILALSGHQPNTPAGWRGGNRLAIHGTNSPGTIGVAASAGCLRGSDADLRTLIRRVPVGTPLFIRP